MWSRISTSRSLPSWTRLTWCTATYLGSWHQLRLRFRSTKESATWNGIACCVGTLRCGQGACGNVGHAIALVLAGVHLEVREAVRDGEDPFGQVASALLV